jgi:hypothetical protein
LSGRDGSVIWQSSESSSRSDLGQPHRLTTTITQRGRLLVVGFDPAFSGLRGLELPQGLIKGETH